VGRLYCSNPYEHERDGREAARYGRDYTSEHREMMRNRYDDECARVYAEAYRGEQRRIEARREEEREEERALRARRQRIDEEEYWERQYPEEQPYLEEPSPEEPPSRVEVIRSIRRRIEEQAWARKAK